MLIYKSLCFTFYSYKNLQWTRERLQALPGASGEGVKWIENKFIFYLSFLLFVTIILEIVWPITIWNIQLLN